MQTQLRVGVIRAGVLVDDRWLATNVPVSMGASAGNPLRIGPGSARVSGVHVRPGRLSSVLQVPPGVIGQVSVDGGEPRALDGEGDVELTLSSGARGWLRVGDSTFHLEQAVRPPPPPRSTLPRTVTLGRRPLDRRLATAFLSALVVAAVMIVVALRRPSPLAAESRTSLDGKPARVVVKPPAPPATPETTSKKRPSNARVADAGPSLTRAERETAIRERPAFKAIGATVDALVNGARNDFATLDSKLFAVAPGAALPEQRRDRRGDGSGGRVGDPYGRTRTPSTRDRPVFRRSRIRPDRARGHARRRRRRRRPRSSRTMPTRSCSPS